MEFLLTIFLIYFTFRLFSRFIVRYIIRKGRKTTEKEGYDGHASRKQKKKKKIFRKDDGEYVDYEEIKH